MNALDFNYADAYPFSDEIISRRFRCAVEPVAGATSASGAVFRFQGYEIFVSRRWQAWDGAFWCIIDFTSPLTGYVAKRSGGMILDLMKNEDGKKIQLMPEHEEALYRYFSLIVENEINALQQSYPFRFKVEITRLYPPAGTVWNKVSRESEPMTEVA